MAKFKNIRIAKPGGGKRTQRVQVLASGKYKFVKNLKKSKSSNPSSKKKTRKVRRKVARKKKRRSSAMTIPLAPIGGFVVVFTSPEFGGKSIVQSAMEGDYNNIGHAMVGQLTGWDTNQGKWMPERAHGLMALIVGTLIHKFVGGRPLNVNAMLARAKVPFVRI